MNPNRFYIILFFLILLGSGQAFSQEGEYKEVKEICPGKLIQVGGVKLKLTAIEKTLLCGDRQVPAWQEIPFNQVRFNLRNFLQERGYHRPEIWLEGSEMYFDPGKPTVLTQVIVLAHPPFTEIKRKRQIIGKRLTPKLLNLIEDWIRGELRSQGYPCPKIRSRGNILTGVMEVTVDRGTPQEIQSIIQQSVPGLGSGTLRRFDAFELEKEFNDDLLILTSRRVTDSGVVQSSHITWSCEQPLGGEEPYQRIFPGKPRLFTIGFGFDTEEYGILKSTWKHARWGSKASNFAVDLYASFRRQRLDISAEWYAFSPLSRWYLYPLVNFKHDYEDDYQYISNNVQFALGRTYDNQELGLRFTVGPNLNHTYTFSGADEGLTRFLSLSYSLELKSHYFEYWEEDPRTGYYFSLLGDFNSDKIYSSITAQRFKMDWKYYYNFKNFDPPLLVFGVRGGFYGTLMDRTQENIDTLPPNYKYYLGGSQNLRGFSRKELPGEEGALSAAFMSVEIRLANYIPYWIQPFIFFDVGILGNNAFDFNLPVYYNPGGGIRLASPIGVFRTTFAHGYKAGGDDGNPDNTHFQFLFSYGEEF